VSVGSRAAPPARFDGMVGQTTRLNQIGFPEFTTKLITDVFDALIVSNLRQMEAFAELLAAVGKELNEYIADTEDDIDGGDIMEFLARALPPVEGSDQPSRVHIGGSLTSTESADLAARVTVPGEDAPDLPDGDIDEDAFDAILAAVARRIAARKYDLLTEMVRQGLLRLVVETGTIETRLTFTTYAQHTSARQRATHNARNWSVSESRSSGVIQKLLTGGRHSASSQTGVTVSTTSEQDRDISGSRVQIYGGVTINFKTDYLPLAT
jgi:hypothetical protein